MAGPIDVVIPVYNRYELTARCLSLLSEQTVTHRVIVVDDGSTDSTPQRLRDDWPKLTLVRLEGNAGFSRACNRGVAQGSAEVLVLLNNDVECRHDFLEQLTRPLRDPTVGSVAPLMLQAGGTRIDSVGLAA